MTIREKLESDLKSAISQYQALRIIAANQFNEDNWNELLVSASKLHAIQERHKQGKAILDEIIKSEPQPE